MFKLTTPVLASLHEAETIQFYTEKLGFSFRSVYQGYLIFSRDGLNLHLWPCDNAEIAKHTGCYIYVTDLDQLYEVYRQLGLIHPNGTLRLMPWGLRQFAVADNNGNILYFSEYKEDIVL